MKVRRLLNRKESPKKRGRGFAGAVLLVAGLALGGCVRTVVKRPEPAVCTVKAKSTRTHDHIKYTTYQKIIKAGDEFKIPYHYPPEMKLLKADEKGVEVQMAEIVERQPYGQARSLGSFNEMVHYYFDRCPEGKVRLTVIYPNIPGRNEANDASLRP